MNGYQLTKQWFDFAYESSDVKSQHTALYSWLIELNNRLQWKESFGLPTQEACEYTGIGNRKTFYAALDDLEKWGFIKTVRKSNNQNASRIISLCLSEFAQAEYKQSTSTAQAEDKQSTSTAPIVKQLNNVNNKTNKHKKVFVPPSVDEVRDYFQDKGFPIDLVQHVYSYYADADWTKSNGSKVIDWKRTISNNWQEKFERHRAKQQHQQNANQTYYPPKPEEDPILLRQEVHSNYGDYVRHCLKVNHKPEKPKYPELFPADFDYVAFINQIKAEL